MSGSERVSEQECVSKSERGREQGQEWETRVGGGGGGDGGSSLGRQLIQLTLSLSLILALFHNRQHCQNSASLSTQIRYHN